VGKKVRNHQEHSTKPTIPKQKRPALSKIEEARRHRMAKESYQAVDGERQPGLTEAVRRRVRPTNRGQQETGKTEVQAITERLKHAEEKNAKA